jgi:hypothetical protein
VFVNFCSGFESYRMGKFHSNFMQCLFAKMQDSAVKFVSSVCKSWFGVVGLVLIVA